jgi:CRISPR-associated protein Cas1
MKEEYYILSSGTLRREGSTVYFENETERRIIPVEQIGTIYGYGQLTVSSGVIGLLCKAGIPVHFFGYYGNYEGTLWPKETLVSGDVIVKQAQHYSDMDKRMVLAKAFVDGAAQNILKNLTYYARTIKTLEEPIGSILLDMNKIRDVSNPPELMNVEGRIRAIYYKALDLMFPDGYKIETRTRQPPENRMNALISFGNSLCYGAVISEIYSTQLHPAISYLHEPSARRFSLALDVAEIFKPILVDRIIFKLVNKNMLSDASFMGELGDMLLSENGRKLFLKEWHEKLETTIEHKSLEKRVSYKRLIRLELYKLIKHILDEAKYKPLVMWW